MNKAKLTWKTAGTAFLLGVVQTTVSPAQLASSLTEREIESSETRTTLEALVRENTVLREKLQQSEASNHALQKNLATSNAEAEVLKRKVSELHLRLEALGLEAAGDESKLEQRLLKAVNDLRLGEDEKRTLQEALIELSEAVLRFQKVAATEDAESRGSLEAALRKASRALGSDLGSAVEAAPVSATLTDASIISIKEDLALVVANVGRKHGVQAGMPFRVIRDGEDIGVIRVVDVREKIAGAVVQDLRSEKEKIRVGDRLKVGAVR
jgi:chromosome segregation ATPase